MNTSIKNLKQERYVVLPYPPVLKHVLGQAMSAWKSFCALPKEVKTSLPYSNNSTGVGYELKEGNGPRSDHKENFDITIKGQDWLQQHYSKAGDWKALSFIQRAVDLVDTLEPLALQFAQEVEEQLGVPGYYEEVKASKPTYFIRFIHYPAGVKVGEVIATPHADQSAITLHLEESTSGFRILVPEKGWLNVEFSKEGSTIIPSMQSQLFSQGKLEATWHDVVANEVTAKEGRYSAVCFIQFPNTPKYDKAKWGRIQEWDPGCTYGMDSQKFSKYFKA